MEQSLLASVLAAELNLVSALILMTETFEHHQEVYKSRKRH